MRQREKYISRADPSLFPWGILRTFFQGDPEMCMLWLLLIYFPFILMCAHYVPLPTIADVSSLTKQKGRWRCFLNCGSLLSPEALTMPWLLCTHTPQVAHIAEVAFNECCAYGSSHHSLSQTNRPDWPQSYQNVQAKESVWDCSRKSSRVNWSLAFKSLPSHKQAMGPWTSQPSHFPHLLENNNNKGENPRWRHR